MRRIKYLIIKEFKQLFRDKKLLPPIFLAPVIQLILMGYAVTFDIKNISLSVYDMDNSATSRKLISGFTSSGYFVIKSRVDSYDKLEQNIQKNKVSMGLVIPLKFEKNIKK